MLCIIDFCSLENKTQNITAINIHENIAVFTKCCLLLNFSLEYATRKIQDDQEGPGLNGLNQVFVYADYVICLGRI
jgi:hypothetical protein